jgi:hypothetical protein
MRTKGAKSKHGNYVSDESLNKKAAKLQALMDDFIDKSLRNGYFNKQVDYNKMHEMADHLKWLSTFKPDR